jgi:hypothetical protein
MSFVAPKTLVIAMGTWACAACALAGLMAALAMTWVAWKYRDYPLVN